MYKKNDDDCKQQKRKRNRKRSKRRAILCPVHSCYVESVSQKQRLYASSLEQLQGRGLRRNKASMLLSQQTTVPLSDEWLEAFWCDCCEQSVWYHVCRDSDNNYSTAVAPRELWQQAQGVINPEGNPSVGEFTRRSACSRGTYRPENVQLI